MYIHQYSTLILRAQSDYSLSYSDTVSCTIMYIEILIQNNQQNHILVSFQTLSPYAFTQTVVPAPLRTSERRAGPRCIYGTSGRGRRAGHQAQRPFTGHDLSHGGEDVAVSGSPRQQRSLAGRTESQATKTKLGRIM